MTKSSFRVVYDSSTDTLYVTADDTVSSMARDGDPDHFPHYAIGSGDLVGVNTDSFNAYWGDRFDALPRGIVPRSSTKRAAAAR